MSEERLSANLVFIRYVMPAAWLAIVLAVLTSAVRAVPRGEMGPLLAMLPGVAVFMAIATFIYWKFLWGLADVVVLSGDTLRVRRRGVEQRIPLADVMNVSVQQWGNPKRITLRLRRPGAFGDEVAFSPRSTFQLNPFARHPVAELLIARVDAARRKEMA